MIKRIPQRNETDCSICAVAMAMRYPFTYERVLSDSDKYAKVSEVGKFFAWWEPYLRSEGFRVEYRPFKELYDLPKYGGRIVGLLGMTIPNLKMRHIVAVDELGVIDPATDAPDHIDIGEYSYSRNVQGVNFDEDFLVVEQLKPAWRRLIHAVFRALKKALDRKT